MGVAATLPELSEWTLTVLANKGKGVLGFKVTSKALSTSSSASLSSLP